MRSRSGWPPNSAAEWVVGQNFRSWGRKNNSSSSNPILRVEISEDEASGDETVAITYPGRRRRAESAQHAPSASAATSSRKVRFDGARRPLKSAMKKRASPSSSSDTLVDTSDDDSGGDDDDDDDTTSSNDGESSGFDETDTSEDESPPKRKSRNKKSSKAKAVVCKKVTEWDPDAVDDPLPHPKCPCGDCRKARKVMKAMVQFEAMAKAAEKESRAKKQEKRKRKKANEASSTDVTDTNTTTTTETDADTTEADTTQGGSDEGDKPKPPKGKNKKQKQTKQSKRNENPEPKPKPAAEEPKKAAIDRTAFKMPQYPKEMQPNLIMPPRARVMQVEHTIEGPNDPQPNAFFDSNKGITRVYHGPQWGNHMAELYGNYNPARFAPGPCAPIPPPPAVPAAAPLPPGYPAAWPGQSPYHPWWMPPPPPPPPGTSFAQAAMHHPQIPSNEAAMRDAASKGFGLSGMPAAEVPSHIQEMQKEEVQKAASRNAGSEKGSKKDAWGATSLGDQCNKNNGGGWGSDDHKKNGCLSPVDFSWGKNNGDTFSRKSNQNGSQKNGSAGGWGSNDQTNEQRGGNAWNNDGNNNNTWGNKDGNQQEAWAEGTNNNGNSGGGDCGGEFNKSSPQQQSIRWDSGPNNTHASQNGSSAGGNGNGNGNDWRTMPGAWVNNEQNDNFTGNGGGAGHGSRNSKPKGAFPWPDGVSPPAENSGPPTWRVPSHGSPNKNGSDPPPN